MASGSVGPDVQDVKIEPGGSYDFLTSVGSAGLSATRYWPKLGCDAAGNNCDVGESGGPGEGCVTRGLGAADDYSRCAPPIDSKFEGTFAAPDAPDRDTVDMSLVDGFSLPFKFEVNGNCIRDGLPFQQMDCSGLSVESCPKAENLGALNRSVNLHAFNPSTGKFAGCFSPCMKLVDDKWGTPAGRHDAENVAPYCCTGAFGSPEVCTPGPVSKLQYLKQVRRVCPYAYGYAYDDVKSTIVCSATTRYMVTFFCLSA